MTNTTDTIQEVKKEFVDNNQSFTLSYKLNNMHIEYQEKKEVNYGRRKDICN